MDTHMGHHMENENVNEKEEGDERDEILYGRQRSRESH